MKPKIKSALRLIEFAKDHGFAIGLRRSGVYYIGSSNGERYSETEFKGTWSQFVDYVRALCDMLQASNKELELQRIDLWDEVCQLQELVADAYADGHASGWNRENGDLAWKAWSHDKHLLN